MSRAKKVINDPKEVVQELLEGLVLAYQGKVKMLPGHWGLVKNEIADGKVALLIGGGSGHEPLFHGFIGENMADGAACGNIFAAPDPETILEVTKALHRGKGVLYLYGNYAGDNMNFDMAAELAEEEGIETYTVRVKDDVATEKVEDRRGIAGDVFMIKIAGAAAATMDSLKDVARVTEKAMDNIRSLAVALKAGSTPQSGEPTFELADDELEIGMGAHGEPGVRRDKMKPADQLIDEMMDLLLKELSLKKGDKVALLLNDLGATTMMELLIVNRRIRKIFDDMGVTVYDTIAGKLVTTQEMAGFSITLMKLDDELQKYYDMPCSSFGLTKEAR